MSDPIFPAVATPPTVSRTNALRRIARWPIVPPPCPAWSPTRTALTKAGRICQDMAETVPRPSRERSRTVPTSPASAEAQGSGRIFPTDPVATIAPASSIVEISTSATAPSRSAVATRSMSATSTSADETRVSIVPPPARSNGATGMPTAGEATTASGGTTSTSAAITSMSGSTTTFATTTTSPAVPTTGARVLGGVRGTTTSGTTATGATDGTAATTTATGGSTTTTTSPPASCGESASGAWAT